MSSIHNSRSLLLDTDLNKSNKGSRSAYEQYKANLHAFFDGKRPLPDHIRKQLDDENKEEELQAPPVATKSEKVVVQEKPGRPLRRFSKSNQSIYSTYIEAIDRAVSEEEINHSIDALLDAGFELPKQQSFLSKAIAHKNESLVSSALKDLQKLLLEEPAKSPSLLRSRLQNTLLNTSSEEIKNLCNEIRQKLGTC